MGIPHCPPGKRVHTFTQPCTASRRDGGDSLPLEYRLITGPRVIGPVARDLNEATRNLIQQGRQQTTVVDPARCNLHRHHLFRPLIDTQVQLTPGSAPTMSMLSDVPFTRAVHSQARRIHNHVPRPTAWANSQERRQGTLSSTESAVVWNWQIESEQLQERRNEALRRPKAKLKHRLQYQRTLNGRVGVNLRSAGALGRVGVPPGGNGVLIEPKGQTPPWRSAPDCSLTSCVLGTGTCIDSASFLMLAPWPIGDKRTCRSDLCNNAPAGCWALELRVGPH